MSNVQQLRREILKRKQALERKRLRLSFEEKMRELEQIVEWLDSKNWSRRVQG